MFSAFCSWANFDYVTCMGTSERWLLPNAKMFVNYNESKRRIYSKHSI